MKKLLIVLPIVGVVVLVALVLGARILGPRFIAVPPPSGAPIGAYDFPRPETSRLGVKIAVPLSAFSEIANAKVPDRFTGSESKNFHKRIKGGGYAWEVVRGPIEFTSDGSGLTFASAFAGRAVLQGNLDASIISIPLKGNADIAGVAGGRFAPAVQPDWGVDPHFVPAMRFDKATLQLGQLGQIDVGEFLGGTLGQYLQKEIGKIAPILQKSINLRHEVEKLWTEAHIVKQVSDDPAVWVGVTPTKVFLGPFDYSNPEEIGVSVAIESQTRLTNRAPAVPVMGPLPPLNPLEGTDGGTDLRLPLVISMTELNEVLAKEDFDIDTGVGTKIKVDGIAAEVGQGGYLNLKLDLEADKSRWGRGVAGTIWVRGRPVIDYEEQTLGFADVELTVETLDKLTVAAAWLLEGFLVKGLEGQLRVDLDDYKAELDEEVQKAIANAKLPAGIDVSLRDLEVRLTDIYTTTRHVEGGEPDPGIVLVIRATGDMSTRITHLKLKAEDTP